MQKTRVLAVLALLFAAGATGVGPASIIPSAAFAETINFQADSVSRERVAGRETTVLSGAARVETDRILVSANRITLSGEGNRYYLAEGSVSLYDKERNISLKAVLLHYDRTLDILKLSGSVELEDHDNRVYARASRIEFRGEQDLVLMQISVRIFKNDIACRAELAVYDRGRSSLELT